MTAKQFLAALMGVLLTLGSAILIPATASADPLFEGLLVGESKAAMYTSGFEYDVVNDRLVIADTGLDRVLFYSTDGALLGSFGQPGSGDGEFDAPRDAAVDGAGNIYIAEGGGDRIQSFTSAGAHRWTRTNTVDCFCLNTAIGLTWDDANDTLIVAAAGSNRISGWSESGDRLWISDRASDLDFSRPRDAGRAPDGTLWVADYANDRIGFYDVSPTGVWTPFSPAQPYLYVLEGDDGDSRIRKPYNVDFSDDGQTIFIASTGNATINRFDISAGVGNAVVLPRLGSTCPEHPDPCPDPPATGRFNQIRRVVVDDSGAAFVADFWGGGIVVFESDGTIRDIEGYTAPLPGVSQAAAVDIAPDGTRYVFDRLNHRVQRFDADGNFLNATGARGKRPGYFSWPEALTVTPDGSLWAIDTRGGILHRFDADLMGGAEDFEPDSDPIGALSHATGADAGPDGSVWVTDSRNDRIVRFDPATETWSAWGTGGSIDGQLNRPDGIAVTGTAVYVADALNNRIQQFTLTGDFVAKSTVPLNQPEGIEIATDGSIWVADTGNHRVVRLSADLSVMEEEFGSFGTGPLEFDRPRDLAVEGDRLFVADTDNHRVQIISVIDEPEPPVYMPPAYDSEISDSGGVAPMYPSSAVIANNGDAIIVDAGGNRLLRRAPDGTITPIPVDDLNHPRGIAWDPSGIDLWLSDTSGHRLVKVSETGTILGTIGGKPALNSQQAIDSDSTGIYVANTYGHDVVKFASDGTELWRTSICSGEDLRRPRDLALGDGGEVFIVDTDNDRVVVLDAATGACLDSWGVQGSGPGQLRAPRAIVSDGQGGVWVGDAQNFTLIHFSSTGLLLSETEVGYGTGPNEVLLFNCLYRDGDRLNVCDMFGHQIQSYLVDPGGTASFDSTIGGVQPAPGGFYGPFGVGLAPNGDLYVADWWNHRMQRFDATSNFVNEWGMYGSAPGSMIFPRDVAVQPDGTVVVTNSEASAIDLFDPSGVFLSRIRPQGAGERFLRPHQTALAPDGTFWVADTNNKRVVHVDAAGVVLDDWTSAAFGFSKPGGVALDDAGNVYVADTADHTVSKYAPDGVLVAVLATFGSGPGSVRGPQHLEVATYGGTDYLFIADGSNHRVQLLTLDGVYVDDFGERGSGPGQFIQPHDVAVGPDGRIAVADYGNDRISFWTPGAVDPDPDTTILEPTPNAATSSPVTISGLAVDDTGIAQVRFALRDRGTLAWLQPDGTFGPTFALIDATLASPGAPSTTWSSTLVLPSADYRLTVRSVDVDGTVESTRPFVKFTVN